MLPWVWLHALIHEFEIILEADAGTGFCEFKFRAWDADCFFIGRAGELRKNLYPIVWLWEVVIGVVYELKFCSAQPIPIRVLESMTLPLLT